MQCCNVTKEQHQRDSVVMFNQITCHQHFSANKMQEHVLALEKYCLPGIKRLKTKNNVRDAIKKIWA